MRILHVTPTYAPAIGGIEEVVWNLARHGRRAGLEVDIVHVAPRLQRRARHQDSIVVTTLPLRGHRMLGWAHGLEELACEYDVLHVHDPQVGALTLNIGGLAAQVPAVLSTHGGFFHTNHARRVKRFHAEVTAPRMLRRYSQVLASSEPDLAAFTKLSPDNTILVENGVDTGKFRGPRQAPHDLTRWIFWGRFSRNKRLDALVRLVASLASQGLRIDLAICGTDFDGTLASLQQLATASGVGQQITFRIGLDEKALREEIATRSVFVLPSEYEGFGLSILEAMAAGLVPLCRDIAPMNVLAGGAAVLLDFDGGMCDIVRIRDLLKASAGQVEEQRALGRGRAAFFDWSTRFDPFLRQYETCLRKTLS
jgi:alpha-1,3-mannosyltransferase